MSQNLLSVLLDNLQDYALFQIDERGITLSWTPGVAELLGYGEGEFIGIDASLIFSHTDRDRGRPRIEMELAARNGRATARRWHRRKDGTVFWGESQLIALRDDDGVLTGYVKIVRDDTGRKRIEDDLRETRERLQTALDVGGIGTWTWDIPNDQVMADVNLARFFGVSALDAMGGPIENYIRSVHPDDVDRVLGSINESIAQDIAFSEEYRLLQEDGSVLWVEARGKIDQDFHGRPLHLNGVVLDITARKKDEEARSSSEERYRTLFEAIDNGFCVVEMIYDENQKAIDYRFLEINPTFEKQTGLRGAIGKTVRELVPDLDEFWFETYGKIGLTGESVQFENWAEALGRWFDVHGFRVGPPELHRVALLFTDITSRKEGEKALRQAHLESEETNRIKDQFLATLSHELRTPLNSILGWANILRTNEMDRPTQKKGLETIERNARSQAQLIDDLLDVSRILTGKMRVEMSPVDLANLLENAIKNVLPAIEARQIELKTDIDHSIGFLSADEDRLGQVFWNLLTNAIKFTPKGGCIGVTLQRVDSQVEIQICDSGRGIAPEFIPYLFERFRQEDASSTRIHGGLGIGLALVRHLVEAHGGQVYAESEGEGRGSIFTIKFPIQAVRLSPEEKRQVRDMTSSQADDDQRATKSLHGLRILVVDDEADAREMLQHALEQQGAQVVTAGNSHEAFEHFLESRETLRPFNVLVSDIGMPGSTGHELVRQIRACETTREDFLPAVAVTAYASPKDRMEALLAGFQEHIAKPIDPDDLVATIVGLTGHFSLIEEN